jgi:NAD-dependent dihydropyrimidine dehydrogenase PreA subunit
MRLDWFLPMIRRPKPGIAPARRSRLVTWSRALLPARLFSNWETKQRGLLRNGLRKLGLSWLASPNRRLVQAICFVAFLVLFFWVCWPYDAQPSRSWSGWSPAEVDAESGGAIITHESVAPDMPTDLNRLFVTDLSLPADDPAAYLGEFSVEGKQPPTLRRLTPRPPVDAERLAAILLSPGPWKLSEAPPDGWPAHYADNLAAKERVAAEFFLVIDPLLSLSTGVAARSWVWSLACAGVILLICVVIPRGFCGYLCPLGTLIDLFDWSIGRRITRFRVADDGWWVHIKYYVLLGVMVAAVGGVLLSGFVAAIPVITRGMLFTLAPLQNGVANGWHQVPPFNAGHVLSLVLFFAVLGLGLLRPRFWCKYACPSGAVFSLGNLFRVSERKVESSCIHCNKCIEICPFDAIKLDFTTRVTDCTLCQSCGGVCPTHAIKFVGRWEADDLKPVNDPPTHETALGRRGFLASSVGTMAGTVGGVCGAAAASVWGANLDDPNAWRPVRPPGSVPEQEFLQMCIRCGECFKACPSDVLQPMRFQQGLEGLWTPHVIADWAGCASSCNACGQVCPTGAIRALPLEEKRVARMGLAIVNEQTCLPFAGREACQLCVDECHNAGYHAIEFTRVGTELDDQGQPVEGSGYLAPLVLAEKCVGCGLCQTRCYGVNVAAKGLLDATAILIEAGAGRDDRLMSGSYVEWRQAEAASRAPGSVEAPPATDYLPSFLQPTTTTEPETP